MKTHLYNFSVKLSLVVGLALTDTDPMRVKYLIAQNIKDNFKHVFSSEDVEHLITEISLIDMEEDE